MNRPVSPAEQASCGLLLSPSVLTLSADEEPMTLQDAERVVSTANAELSLGASADYRAE